MEELLIKLLSGLQFPTIVISLSVILFKIIKFLPITFVTAQDIEKKIYTKEQRLLHQVIHYIFNMLLATMLMVPVGDFFANNSQWYVPSIALSALIYIFLFYLLIFWMGDQRKRIKNISKARYRVLFILGAAIYSVAIIVLPPYFTGSLLGSLYTVEQGKVISEYLLVLILIHFFYSGFILFMFKPLNKVLALKSEKVVSIEIEKNNKIEKWYLLYPVKTDSFLIGDHYMPELCKRNRIITKDELLQKEFIIEELEDIKRDASHTEIPLNQ
jgi:hypothetical protein